MAAPTTGHTRTDHLRIMGLAEAAAHFACDVLEPGGVFLAKVLQGGTERELLDLLKREFATVRHVKPPASAPIPPSSTCWRRAFAGRSTRLRPRGVSARGFGKKGSAGAGSLRLATKVAAFPRPRRQLSAEGAQHDRQRALEPQPASLSSRPNSSGASKLCALDNRNGRCGRASVRFVASPHSLDRRPRDKGERPHASVRNGYSTPPHSGTAPCPAKPLS